MELRLIDATGFPETFVVRVARRIGILATRVRFRADGQSSEVEPAAPRKILVHANAAPFMQRVGCSNP